MKEELEIALSLHRTRTESERFEDDVSSNQSVREEYLDDISTFFEAEENVNHPHLTSNNNSNINSAEIEDGMNDLSDVSSTFSQPKFAQGTYVKDYI